VKARLTSHTGGWLFGVLSLALSALALVVGVSQGLAGARADGSATVPVFRHADPGDCPPSGNKVVGSAQFKLKGHTLTVKIKLHGDPGAYFVALWSGSSCSWTGNLYGKFKTDGSSDGSYTFSTTVSGRSFYVDVYNDTTGQSNASAIANL